MSYVRSIRVTDAKGDELTIHEFQDRRLWTKVRRLRLDTGEVVHPVEDSFVIAATGERLMRISG